MGVPPPPHPLFPLRSGRKLGEKCLISVSVRLLSWSSSVKTEFCCFVCFHSAFRLYERLANIWMIVMLVEFFCEHKNHLSNLKSGIPIIDLDLRSVKHPFNQNYEPRQLHHNSCYCLAYISLREQLLQKFWIIAKIIMYSKPGFLVVILTVFSQYSRPQVHENKKNPLRFW